MVFKENRNKYFECVCNESITVLFSGMIYQKSADQDFDFEVDKNFYYLTGINQDNVILVLEKGIINKEILFIEKNDPNLVKWVGAKLYIEEAAKISGIDDVRYIDSFDNFIYLMLNNSRASIAPYKKLFLNLERRNTPHYSNLALKFAKKVLKDYPELEINNSYNIIVGLRMIKSEYEIEKIKESIDVTKSGLELLMKKSKSGIKEYQLENYFDFHLKNSGQRQTSFKTICASGKNATILHYVKNDDELKENDLILFDLGCRSDFYISDISRTFPINGRFTERQKDVYNAVLNVNKKCIEFLHEGITWAEYNKFARDLLTKAAIELKLIKDEKEIIKYYWHSIGHSIGLDTHDPSLYIKPLTAGMVITVEPGLYIEEEGIGVRIEDNVLITKNGCINLSSNIIKEVIDIEEFMKK